MGLTETRRIIRKDEVVSTGRVARFIAGLQRASGDIPWHVSGKTDPWDLVECAMGLNVGGYHEASVKVFEWLKTMQNAEGSWYSSYRDSIPDDRTCETHMAAYMATGLFHTWLVSRDTALLADMWPAMEKGIDFTLGFQTPSGEIHWAKSPEGKVDPMSLLAASSSIFMSLKCALSVASILGKRRRDWENGFEKLGRSLSENTEAYNRSKDRFSMYWFYPVLCGAIRGEAAGKRIDRGWSAYVIEGQGARCVTDEPWVTIAETCELVLALDAMGEKRRAREVFSWIRDRVYEDRTFWCGFTCPDMVIWPEEKISWTNAVALMAADAVQGLTPASELFSHSSWDGFVYTGFVN